jgi:hypothetical protein
MRLARARLAAAVSGRRPLVPLAAIAFTTIGVFADPRNDVGGSWAVTSVLGFALAAWLVTAVERGVPEPADAMLTVAAGGPGAAARARMALVGFAAALVSAAFIAYPLAIGYFEPGARLGDVAAAALLHLASACAGGALALLVAPPARLATAFAVILAAVMATVALSGPLGPVAGPGGAAKAFSDARRGAVSGGLVIAVAVTLAEAALVVGAARITARRRG